MKKINPDTIVKSGSNYNQAMLVPANARRLIISGQVGRNPDSSIAGGMEAQMERCWLNIFAILDEAEMSKDDLVKATVFVTRPDSIGLYREVRDRMFDDQTFAVTFVVISELAGSELFVEIEAEAVAV